MANTINWGKIYESTYWGNTDNNISWGKAYADLAGVVPALVSEFVSRVEADGGSVESTECMSTDLTFLVNNPEPVAFTGLLNDYSGAAAAYSLRLLDNTYSGNAIKVRRSSDNAEQDIAFTNNELDTTSLETFAGSGDAFVTTWYDQSGSGNDATQATAAEQPKIVENGTTITEGTKPSLDFSSSKELGLSSVSISSNAYSFFGVANTTGTANRALFRNRELGSFGTIEGAAFFELTSADIIANTFMDDGQGNAIVASSGSASDGYHLISTHYTLSTASLYIDTTKEGSSSMGAGTTPLNGPIDFPYINIGGRRFSRPWNNAVQEIVLYDNDKLSNRSGIETNINDFYSIY
jgi:hypothetical protein